jgi:hypothetical protein
MHIVKSNHENDFAVITSSFSEDLPPGLPKEEKQSQLFSVRRRNILARLVASLILPGVNFLEKLPVSLKSCSKWFLQYSTPSIEE